MTWTSWGHQTKESYQCDHIFVDTVTPARVQRCAVIDNEDVRHFSDHGPVELILE
jgi:endonuclease/exonuclease/phosphatase family metal-dependent hydrolase